MRTEDGYAYEDLPGPYTWTICLGDISGSFARIISICARRLINNAGGVYISF